MIAKEAAGVDGERGGSNLQIIFASNGATPMMRTMTTQTRAKRKATNRGMLGAIVGETFSRAKLLLIFGLSLSFPPAQAGTLKTLDGQSFDGEIQFTDQGGLLVKSASQEPVTIELTNLARATFASGPFLSGGSTLPNGWLAQDIGETRGFSRLETNAFLLRVEGESTNANACHFVARSMSSDGQFIARVEQVGGSGFAQAGIMIRSQNSSVVFAAVAIGSDGILRFQRHPDPDRRETKVTTGPQVNAPVWLRLHKSEKLVTASWSTDGSQWQVIDREAMKLSAEKTWREGEGELTLLRASCGVFASSRGKGTTSTARVVPLIMTMHGLIGEYFSGRDFRQLKLARVDPQIRFNWALGSPDPALDKDAFSVRWTGKIIAPRTSAYVFYFDPEESARLWINEQEMPQASFKKAGKPTPDQMIPFTVGATANIRMEFENGAGPAAVKLGWGMAGKPPEMIPMTNFLCLLFATNSPESIALSRVTNNSPAMRGVLLRDGSFLAGTVVKAGESAVSVSLPGRKDVPVLISKIARIYLKPPPQSLPYENVHGRSGVFTKGGDFYESEFRGIEHGTLTTSSVLFGLKHFRIDGGEPLVVVLNDGVPSAADWEVRLLDGTALRSANLKATAQSVTVNEPALGSISVSHAELFEVRRIKSAVANP